MYMCNCSLNTSTCTMSLTATKKNLEWGFNDSKYCQKYNGMFN